LNICYDTFCEVITDFTDQKPCIDHFRDNFCHPVLHFYQLYCPNFTVADLNNIANKYMSIYLEKSKDCFLHEHSKGILNKVSQIGIQQSILSAQNQILLEQALKFFQIDHLFDHVQGHSSNIADGKIAHAKIWFDEHQLSIDNTIIIGDTDHDAEVAKALGIDCILVASGLQSRKRLEQSGYLVIDGLVELC
jgi:phosphoglycolate phosphatase